MTKVSREEMLRLLAGEVPDDEAEKLLAAIDADPDTQREFDDLSLESLAPPGFFPSSEPLDDDQEDEPPKLRHLVEGFMDGARRTERWSFDAGGQSRLRQLVRGDAKTATIAARRATGGKLPQDWPRIDKIPLTLERVGGEGLKLRVCGLPAGYEPVGMRLTRLEHFPRKKWERRLTFRSLEKWIDQGGVGAVSAQSPQEAAPSFAGALSAATDKPDAPAEAPLDDDSSDFRVECNTKDGFVTVEARVPLYREADTIIAELEYQTEEGATVLSKALAVQPSLKDRRSSPKQRLYLPDFDDLISAEVVWRFRSMHDMDLYLPPPKAIDEVLALSDSLIVPAERTGDGEFTIGPEFDFEQKAMQSPETCWTLELARKEEGDVQD